MKEIKEGTHISLWAFRWGFEKLELAIWCFLPTKSYFFIHYCAGHQRWVWDCVFSVDGAYLITGKLFQEKAENCVIQKKKNEICVRILKVSSLHLKDKSTYKVRVG